MTEGHPSPTRLLAKRLHWKVVISIQNSDDVPWEELASRSVSSIGMRRSDFDEDEPDGG